MVILVTGGASSGKSAFGEDLARSLKTEEKTRLIYLATMEPFGEEGRRRIQRHLRQRSGKGFTTLEQYRNIGEAKVLPGDTVLLEDVGNLLANEMFLEEEVCPDALHKVYSGIKELALRCKNLVIITGEVGAGGDYPDQSGEYVRNLGTVNCRLGTFSQQVYLVQAGIPERVK
ncbi:MAG: bifunctional adenosylcobinamide kinase/adenosylcobinamide-phosphate guanylyltransferase [Clostridiales bacterium]|nr:bifunctional adenosylcobinamide kinase/adenosylcobinamide-phosphate guanylyltransferase [Clostridiales bacterium]